MHSPIDNIVGVEHAAHIFQAARHPKSFVVARPRRPSAVERGRRRVRRVDDRCVGRPVPRRRERGDRLRRDPRLRWSSPRPPKGCSSTTSSPAAIGSWPTSRSRSVGSTPDPAPYDFLGDGTRSLHLDDVADVCRPQAAPTRQGHRRGVTRQGPRHRCATDTRRRIDAEERQDRSVHAGAASRRRPDRRRSAPAC